MENNDRPYWLYFLIALYGIAAIFMPVAWWLFRQYVARDYSFGILLVLIPVAIIAMIAGLLAAIPVGMMVMLLLAWALIIVPWYLRRYLYGVITRRWGRMGTAEIIQEKWFDWDGEDCLDGVYVFDVPTGEEYQFTVNFKTHYPHPDEAQKTKQVYGLGAQSPVYYLSIWPPIHYVDFALAPDVDFRWLRIKAKA